jgi:hypothetical protein
LLTLKRPGVVYGFIVLNVTSPWRILKIRAVFGGLFIDLGFAPYFLGPTAYTKPGSGYLRIVVMRAFSIVLDTSDTRSNWIRLGYEFVMGMILVF